MPRSTTYACLLLGVAMVSGCGSGTKSADGMGVGELRTMLSDTEPTRRAEAAASLGHKGTEAKEAVPELAKQLKDDNLRVRLSAVTALGEIGSADAITPLIGALSDRETTVRRQAARALGKIGPAGKAALPALDKTRHDEARIVREAADDAIKKINAK